MRFLLLGLVLTASSPLHAKVLNVEFKFTPFTGDVKEDHVQSVAGKARVLINNVPLPDQEVEAQSLPVMFDEREIAPAVWIPIQSLGAIVRHGKNTIRIEFTPSDTAAQYHAQLRWASVLDSVKEEDNGGARRSTNQDNEGVETKDGSGPLTFEREFTADFADDKPFHHYPPITALTDDDKTELTALVKSRVDALKPDFSAIYKLVQQAKPDARIAQIRKAKCLDAAYAAGVRMTAPDDADLQFVTTGQPEVIIQRAEGELFSVNRDAFAKLKGDEAKMCAAMTLGMAFPARLIVVKDADGKWGVPY